ncbi:MAG: hypothetical protein Q9201_006662 [Fulgogasparrea decipioides]
MAFGPSPLRLFPPQPSGLIMRTVADIGLRPFHSRHWTRVKQRVSFRNFSTTVRLPDGASKPFSPQQLFPNRKGFSDTEIRAIFGKQMDPSKGNQLLHLIQEQRLAGTIDEATPGSQLQKQRALAWLRKNYPANEDQAILNRLDREEEAALRPQGQQGQTSIYGSPVIDRIREENIARQKKREQEEEAEKAKKAEVEAQKLPASTTTAVARKPTAAMQWYEKYRKKAEEAGLKSVPQMSFIQRVGPATLLTVTVVSLCVMFAQNYNPPSRAARLFPDIPPAATTVGALIGVNVMVWLAWKVPPLYTFMNRVFCLVPAYPYASSILGNNLSHQVSKHLVVNLPLFLLSAIVAFEIWGASKFYQCRKRGLRPPIIDHISHLAGYASGIVAAQFLRSPARQKQQTRKGNAVAKPTIERMDRAT